MYCRNCSKEVDNQAVACPSCGVPPRAAKKFCNNCGSETQDIQTMCTKCGVSLSVASAGGKNKVIAGLLAIFLGWLGIHKFYLGYNKEGIIMILISLIGGLITCGAVSGIVSIIALIEGIIYITKTDDEFYQLYVVGNKVWF